MSNLSRTLLIIFLCMALAACASMMSSLPPEHALDKTLDPTALAKQQILVTIPFTPTARKRFLANRKYRAGRYTTTNRTTRALGKDYQLIEIAAWPLNSIDIQCVIYELKPGQSASNVIERLAIDPRVETAQQMNLFQVLGAISYNDPYFNLQHALKRMSVQKAHQTSTGKDVRVAIVDTGVDIGHPDLKNQIEQVKNFVEVGQQNVSPDNHGTAIAGIIAATAQNKLGIIGVAPDAQLIILQACWQPSATVAGYCSSFSLAMAVDFAIHVKSDIINMSLAGPEDALLKRLIKSALANNITVIAAQDTQAINGGFPASLDGVIAAHHHNTTYRTLSGNNNKRAVTAPGIDILSTAPQNGYDFFSGNSMAAAHVSGVAALLLEQEPKRSPQEIHAILKNRNTKLPRLKLNPKLMGTTINACGAVTGVSTTECY